MADCLTPSAFVGRRAGIREAKIADAMALVAGDKDPVVQKLFHHLQAQLSGEDWLCALRNLFGALIAVEESSDYLSAAFTEENQSCAKARTGP